MNSSAAIPRLVTALAMGAIISAILVGCEAERVEGYSPGECSDSIDNDSDGLIDCDDSSCSGSPDCQDPGDDDDSASPCPDAMSAQGIHLTRICAGTFEMGCTSGQSNCQPEESPAHLVTLSRDFWLGSTEVTQGQWQALINNNPASNSACGSECPVEQINWFEAVSLANAVSAAEGLTECYSLSDCSGTVGAGLSCASIEVNAPQGSPYDCEGYRLPTEAEWEFAARGGTDLLYAGSDSVDEVGWHDENSGASSHPVSEKNANSAGLWDMSGNVWEWTWDWYDPTYYTPEPATDPLGANSAEMRSYRGGAWYAPKEFLRVSVRNHSHPDSTSNGHGVRLARTAN